MGAALSFRIAINKTTHIFIWLYLSLFYFHHYCLSSKEYHTSLNMTGRVRMGKTKNYLRYVHDSTFGIVAASQSAATTSFLHMRDTKDRYLAVPANEDIFVWDLKTKQIINKFQSDSVNACEATVIETHHGGHPRTNLIAVGYANGHVRVFEYETGILKSTFAGHRSPVSALKFDRDGSRLASGGKDTNVVLYDVIGEKGLFCLKGHKNIVSNLAFVYNEENQMDLVVSSSTDAVSSLKFWDLKTQHCFCTIPGQGNGIWSFAVFKNNTRLITGSTNSELKLYSIKFLDESEQQKAIPNEDDNDEQEFHIDIPKKQLTAESEYGLKIEHLGNILRNCTSDSSRVQAIIIDPDEHIMICHSTDKCLELYGLRSYPEALTYAKKLIKKEQRRLAKRKRDSELNEDNTLDDSEMSIEAPVSVTSLETLDPQTRANCEVNSKLGSHKLKNKIKAISIAKLIGKEGQAQKFKLAVVATTNQIDHYVLQPRAENGQDAVKAIESIENLSHRSDVRDVSISSDGSLIMTTSAESVKIWRTETKGCICTIETDHATCCTFAEAQHISGDFPNRFGLVGTKQGQLCIIDQSDATVIDVIAVSNDNKPLTSIQILPDRSGIVTGGEDGVVRFFDFVWKTREEEGQEQIILSLNQCRELLFQEGITCVKLSSDSKFIAVALLDSTVRVHFIDTFKYFLTMYGHKFPVTTMDISDDNTLLISGSPDKNIKIWGLDFGDCHKSIFAHDEPITCVKFVPNTHHAFSCSRDKAIKQWDCDHFIKIQTLPKHQAEIWCLDVSPSGKFVVTGSHDKTIRIYRKTEEFLVPSEEEETEREYLDEQNVFEKQENIIIGETELEAGFATKMTIDTVRSADRLMEAIDVFASEEAKYVDYCNQCEVADQKGEPRPAEPEHDPLLMTVMTTDHYRFMLEILNRIKSSELEEILLTLPFDYARRLLSILVKLIEKKWNVGLMVRCAVFILKTNFGRIAASSSLSPVIHKLRGVIYEQTHELRDCAGFNLAGLAHLKHNKKFMSTRTIELT